MNWRKWCVTAIANALEQDHDWDWGRALAAAYWKKHSKLIDHNYHRYLARAHRVKKLPQITEEESAQLLSDYNTKGLNRRA